MRRARKMKRLASNRRRTMELIKCEDKGIMFDIRVEYYMAHDGVGNDKHDEAAGYKD